MQLERPLPYKGYNIAVRNGALGGITATVFSAAGQSLATLMGNDLMEATKRAKTWIDNQDESDATLFLGSLAQRDQDVDRLECELAAANQRIEELKEQVVAWMDHDGQRLSLFYACKAAIEIIADLGAEETDAVFTKLLNAIRLVEPGFNLDETVADQRIDDEGDPS